MLIITILLAPFSVIAEDYAMDYEETSSVAGLQISNTSRLIPAILAAIFVGLAGVMVYNRNSAILGEEYLPMAYKAILIIEDDSNLSRGIAFALEKEGFTVHCTRTVKEGWAVFTHTCIDMIILDLNLPDGDGIEFCRKTRENSNIPIIMLTARDLEADELAGLSAGADDYITKPFSVAVLRARVVSVLRRTGEAANDVIQCGTFALDMGSCKLHSAGQEIAISTTEYRLLKIFMTNVGNVLPKEQILAELWEGQDEFIDDNTLSVNISRLRAKIEENPKIPQVIKTIYGIGYVWAVE